VVTDLGAEFRRVMGASRGWLWEAIGKILLMELLLASMIWCFMEGYRVYYGPWFSGSVVGLTGRDWS